MDMSGIIIGFLIGTMCGVVLTALCVVSSKNETTKEGSE